MEHSRLLKFLVQERDSIKMSDPPTLKIEQETPPNITAEVPPEQKIRQMAVPSTDTGTSTSTDIEVTDTEYTLSPVITVTKKETTLTKGEMKLQKVTVTEDIAVEEMENGSHSISYGESQVTVQTSKQTVSRTATSTDTEGVSDKEEKKHQEKKSRIPKLRFKQTVEKVKTERRDQKSKEQAQNTPRRSSIPKLKDAKLVKRQTSINTEPKQEPKKENLAEAESQILDEFDKIYEDLVDDPKKEIVLAVKIDDPEKVETKFEEIIHAYDSNDDSYLTPTEKIKLSKIPWRRKDDGAHKFGSSADRVRSNNTAAFKDGGFKVSATTITTKRFARGNSADLSTQKVDIVELNTNGKGQDFVKETTVTESISGTPTKTKVISRGIKREISVDSGDDVAYTKKVDKTKANTQEIVTVEEFEGGRKITKETITRQNIRTGIPIKHDRINRSISKELNRRPASLDDRDFVNREVVKHESFKNGGSRTIIQETIVTEIPVKTEKITRGISRTFSRDGKSVTVSAKSKESNNATVKMIIDDQVTEENSATNAPVADNINDKPEAKNEIVKPNIESKDDKPDVKNEIAIPEKRDSIKIGIPVFKTSHSYSKAHIQNVEMSKTIEWKTAGEVRTKSYTRSISDNKKDVGNKHFAPTIIKKESTIETKILKEHVPVTEDYVQMPKEERIDIQVTNIEEIKESLDVTKDTTEETSPMDDSIPNIDSNNILENVDKPVEIIKVESPLPKETEDIKNPEPNKDSNIPKVTILKGNVNRLISQISVKESSDVSRKAVDVEEDLPKKKSVLSKIAMFEGKEPAEFTIKVKKCVIDRKTPSHASKEHIREVPKIVDHVLKPQPKIDPIHDIDKAEIPSEETREDNNVPVIVDQIWKTTEITSSIQQIEDVKILPGNIDFTVSEDNLQTTDELPGKFESNTNIIYTEETTTYPGKIDVSIKNIEFEPIRTLPGKIDLAQNDDQLQGSEKIDDETERHISPITIPAQVDFITNDNQARKYSPERVESIDKQNESDVKKPKVGKLDLNFWQKQVEDNKKFVGTTKNNKQNHLETQKVVSATVVFEANINETQYPKILPGQIEIKAEDNSEIPTIIPGKIHISRDVIQRDTSKSEFLSEASLQVPVILPETPLTKSARADFETQVSHIDVPVILPGKVELTPTINKVETPKNVEAENVQMLPGKVDISINQSQNVSSQILPGRLDANLNNYQAQDSKILPGQINNSADEIQVETGKILPGRIDFKSWEHKVEEARLLPGRIYHNPYENLLKPRFSGNNANEKLAPEELDDVKDDIDDVDREIPSDPELVDSEPEIKETKEPIMSKLRNKIYFIANKGKNKNVPEDVSPVSTEVIDNEPTVNVLPINTHENEPTADSNKVENNESVIENTEFVKENKDFDTKSDIDIEKIDTRTKEDIKRAKSLAELDLGDVVKGQVQRMVYRIKSVDFDRPEPVPTRKISVKEMPRNSVLEKIALFEGKSTTTRWQKRDKFETFPNRLESRTYRSEIRTKTPEIPRAMSVNASQDSLNRSSLSPDEVYLQKVEDLTTAKLRYGTSNMLYLQLANGDQMPAISLGTAMIDIRLTPNIVAAAIDLGFRSIDTAFIYGNEKAVGEGIKMKLNDGTVQREDLFIMSKLWSTFHRRDLVEKACRESLSNLGLEYFDLYMIHNPMSFKEGGDPIPTIASVLQYSEHDYLEAWYGMERLVSLGLVKNIGVSNFNSKQIQRILDKGKIKPVVNQVECHPYLSQLRLQQFCSDRNITLSCYGVLGSKGTPDAWKSGTEAAIDDPMVKVMASGLSKTAAQLLVRYQIQSGRNAVVKASSAAHMWDVLQALTFELQPHEVDAIHALNKGRRTFTFKGMGDTHANYPFNEAF